MSEHSKRIVIKQPHIVTLYDPEYPVCFKILKSGHNKSYSVIEEDPFEHNLSLKNKEDTLKLIRIFDSNFNEDELPTDEIQSISTPNNQTTTQS